MKNKVWDYKSHKTDRLSNIIKKEGKQIIMTKPAMAKYLIGLCDFKEGDIVLEPCKGDGAFYDNIPVECKKDWCEINQGRDFFDYNERVDYIISNPPFVPRKLFWNFHLKSMEITNKKIYWLINMCSINVFTPNRLNIMKDLGWFIQKLHIVSDKRWFGRYCLVEIGKKDLGLLTWLKKSF